MRALLAVAAVSLLVTVARYRTIDELQQELVNQDKRTRAVLEAELAPIRKEIEGLKKRTQLIRRIARAVAHKAGVTQSEIEAQA